MRTTHALLAAAALFAAVTTAFAPGCGSSSDSNPGAGSDDGGGAGDDGGNPFGGDGGGPCTGLACQVVSCASGTHTTVSGTVFAPTMTNPDPLYNAIVYIDRKSTR